MAALSEGPNNDIGFANQEAFYFLARTVLVKDEKHFDKFDRAMSAFWSGLESVEGLMEALIPEDWLRQEFFKQLSEEDKAKIQSLGGLEELIEKFKERLAEQEKRHAGGQQVDWYRRHIAVRPWWIPSVRHSYWRPG